MTFPASPLAKTVTRSILTVAVLVCLSPATSSQTTPSASSEDARIASLLDSLNQVRSPTSAAISPDGRSVAWAVARPRGSELHLASIAPEGAQTTEPERVISPDTVGDPTSGRPGICAASHPAWSPDGKQLALLSDCSGSEGDWQAIRQNNLFVWTLAANTMKQVSHLHGAISDLQWSPDGQAIAFLFVENATRRAGALDAMKPWNGVYGEDGVEVQRVYAINLADGEGYWLTREQLHIYEFSWAPNSNEMAFVAADPPGENTWWIAKLYKSYVPRHRLPIGMMCVTADNDKPDCPSGDEEVVFDPTKSPGPLHGLQIAVPRFSPDGKQIAFIGGIMSDQGSTGGDIYLIPVRIGSTIGIGPPSEPTDITPNRPSSPAWIAWRDNHSLLVSEHTGGSSHITALDLDTGKDISSVNLTLPETIIAGTDVMSLSTSNTANVAVIRQSFDHAPEVWAGPIDNLKQITHLNDTLKPAWGKAESIDYTNEGLHIQGWLLYPSGWSPNGGDPAKKYPLIVSVHGGPSAAVTPRWPTVNYGSVPFSALGYFVFLPNPRGSFGQGEKFTQANIRDFGYGDLRDVLAGVDLLEKRFPIDKYREGITGWSYGGFMTMFAVTRTTRFRAAVAGAGLANWQSYYGENSIDQWMIPFFGASVYDDPAVYAKSSPITFIKRVKTPTLIVVGDRDGECPAPQSFEFWHALRDQGVKTQLVLYPNEGHHFVSPDHQRDVLKRAVDWFEAEMPPK
jgi:dipeptidyl aminopeptidase/acylaminoacyl peptidase